MKPSGFMGFAPSGANASSQVHRQPFPISPVPLRQPEPCQAQCREVIDRYLVAQEYAIGRGRHLCRAAAADATDFSLDALLLKVLE